MECTEQTQLPIIVTSKLFKKEKRKQVLHSTKWFQSGNFLLTEISKIPYIENIHTQC